MGFHYHTWGSNSNHNCLNTICTIGLTFGSVYLFSTSVKKINKLYLSNSKDSLLKYLILFNGSIMLLSGLTFAYITIKLI